MNLVLHHSGAVTINFESAEDSGSVYVFAGQHQIAGARKPTKLLKKYRSMVSRVRVVTSHLVGTVVCRSIAWPPMPHSTPLLRDLPRIYRSALQRRIVRLAFMLRPLVVREKTMTRQISRPTVSRMRFSYFPIEILNEIGANFLSTPLSILSSGQP